jgi:hypothetical protein
MWKKLVAGVLHADTENMGAQTHAQRHQMIRTAVQQLHLYRDNLIAAAAGDQMWDNPTTRPSMILVAPEYMFASHGFQLQVGADLQRNRFMSVADKNTVIQNLRLLSNQYGNQLVMAPGSIAHRDPLVVPGAPGYLASVNRTKAHIRQAATNLNNLRPQAAGAPAIPAMDRRHAGNFWQHPALPPLTGRDRKTEIEGSVMAAIPYFVGHNTMSVYHNGRVVASYEKRAGFHERLPHAGHHNTVFLPGLTSGRKTVGGIDMGCEICLEHGIGILRATPGAAANPPSIHMVCSASVGTNAANVQIRNNGYFLHASSSNAQTEIKQKTAAGGLGANIATHLVNFGGATLKIAEIELNI